MTLLAHFDGGTLANGGTGHVHHDEPIALPAGLVSGSGSWGYTSPDGRRFALEGFHGAWGAYLFPGTNPIVVSDIDGGLFVVRYDG